MKLLKKTLVLLLVCTHTLAVANTANIRFDNIGISQGLSQSTINCVIQDQFGYMWFGTQDGLNRYDGYTFKIFKAGNKQTNGLVSSYINALYEDKQGNIWIGTENGLSIYNRKENKFQSFLNDPKNTQSISGNFITKIYADSWNTLWIATANGLNKVLIDTTNKKINFQVFKHSPTANSISENTVNDIVEDKTNNLWLATSNSCINRYNREKNEFVHYPINNTYNYSCKTVYVDEQNVLWAVTSLGLYYYNRAEKNFEPIVYGTYNVANELKEVGITDIKQIEKNKYWIATTNNGLYQWNNATHTLQHYMQNTLSAGSLTDNRVTAILKDNAGVYWLGTSNGVSKFDPKKQYFNGYNSLADLSNDKISNNIWSVLASSNNVYIGADDGVYVHSNETNTTKLLSIKFPYKGANLTYTIKQLNATELVFAGSYGVVIYNTSTYTYRTISKLINKKTKVSNLYIYDVMPVSASELLVTTNNGLYLLNINTAQEPQLLSSIETNSNNSYNRITRSRTPNQYWIATNNTGILKVVKDGNKYNVMPLSFPNNALAFLKKNSVMHIFEKEKNILWVATFGGGLAHLDINKNTVDIFDETQGLSNNSIYGIVPDDKNNLWLSTNNGVSCFNTLAKTFATFHESDGLPSNEFNLGAFAASPNCKIIYFGSINGLTSFNPADIKINTIAPKVIISAILLANKPLEVSEKGPLKTDLAFAQNIDLSYKDNLITIEFAALHYSNSNKNEYAYMLEGLDEDWNYIGNRRIAIYNKLKPGVYLFKVKASNSDGVWSKTPTTLRITITPPFWGTWWFRILLFITLALAGYLYYRRRLVAIINYRIKLEQKVQARTSEIQEKNVLLEQQSIELAVEKEKSEKLLLNILPQETVDELKNKGKASARHYRSASVMFTDFKGFTTIAESLRPQDLVRELDSYFIKFDEIIERHQIEKIKTIGDAYMCVGGVPVRNKTNPIDIVLAGLEIQRYMQELKLQKLTAGEPHWDLRVGIHTGEIIAGVVGIKRFAYDVWGDTVNVAQRIETACEIGKVNVSGTTYEVIKEFFDFDYRGKVMAKNKGMVDMYYVLKIKPELSVDGLGITPNAAFTDRQEHLLYSKINYRKAEQHVIKLLEEKLPQNLSYHGVHHTLEVCAAAERIGIAEGIVSEDVHLLKTAALLHDAGFTQQYDKNEPIGCELSREILPQFGYSDKQIETVIALIMATQIPHKPQNLMQQIMCDADLDYLGTETFDETSNNLKLELMAYNKIKTDKEWDAIQVHFLTAHYFFTNTCKEHRVPLKQQHLEKVKQRLATYQ
ncbi:MAG: adenylate/guanylate cyclase domain-containing protein [Bacteroidia bacterium]